LNVSKKTFLCLVGLLLTFVAALLAVAPGPEQSGLTWRLVQLGKAIEMYGHRHDGRTPLNLDALAEEDLLGREVVDYLARRAIYIAPDQPRSAASARAIMAVGDLAGAEKKVSVLTGDGNVVHVPIDAFRAAAAKYDPHNNVHTPLVIETDADGNLRVVVPPEAR